MENKLTPHNLEAEKVVIGTIMTERNALSEVRDILSPECFYNPFHRSIYETILKIDKRGDRPDLISVTNEMTKSGDVDVYNLSLISQCYTFDIYQHAALLHDKEKRRKFIEIGSELISKAYSESDDIVDTLSEIEDKLKSLFQSSKDSIFTIKEAVNEVTKQMSLNASDNRPLTGTPTGFSKIDERSGGLQKSDLIVIAADTSSGKTSLAIALTLEASKNGHGVAFYSMEMKKEQIAARMISIESGVPGNEIMFSRLSAEQFNMVDKGIGKIYDKPIFFDDRSTSNIDVILASIRTMKLKYGISGAVVDYLQILSVNMKGSNTEQQMGEVARRLKNLAKELDIWIIALSQLNRDNINPVPTLARLRASGQIAEAADIVMLIYRPEIYGKYYPEPFQSSPTQGTAMIDIAKGRNIGLAKFLVRFEARTTHFREYDEGYNSMPFMPITEEQPF
ncbi:replicative DNA helicase [Parabacteroides provencensis]|uniref:replicative DNA helicase n=1 Tax=Parabacteroides provencensis TaxID=1944636 RepID=UPI000C1580E2|nr:DnaB-like helicase C-terminal domain-containing protein [Parabacteroides provencensis]